MSLPSYASRLVADRVWVVPCPIRGNLVLIAGARSALLAGRLDVPTREPLPSELVALIDDLACGPAAVPTEWAVLTSGAERAADRDPDTDAWQDALGDRVRVLGHQSTAAPHTVSSVRPLDLGGRLVEAIHPGPAATAGDLVLRVGDPDLLVLGDLVVDDPARDHAPTCGPSAEPLVWAEALDLALNLIGDAAVVIPGSGGPVDREFVGDRRDRLAGFAARVRDLASRGVPADRAAEETDWPWDPALLPADELRALIDRAYARLGPGERRLPLA